MRIIGSGALTLALLCFLLVGSGKLAKGGYAEFLSWLPVQICLGFTLLLFCMLVVVKIVDARTHNEKLE